jgi:hypothetical protein
MRVAFLCLTRTHATFLHRTGTMVYDPSLAALAKTFNCEKMICRK